MQKRTLLKAFGLLLVVGLLMAALPAEQAQAATYRTWIAQVPAAPTAADTVRIWMNSDTAVGETAGVEYKIGETYTKVLGSYDNSSYSGANWYADIPAQATGTLVAYQLFTRNEGGDDYGFSDFNWSYTVLPPTTVYVDDGYTAATPGWGLTHFATIQTGIDAVAAGGIVNVAGGTYNEAVVIGKANISLIATEGAVNTTINAGGAMAGIGFGTYDNLGAITINGFTVTNFTDLGIAQSMWRPNFAVHVLNNTVIATNNFLRNGINIAGSGSTIIGNTVIGATYNNPDFGSSAIIAVNGSNILIENNIIQGTPDYGITVNNYNSITDMTGTIVQNNTITATEFGVLLFTSDGYTIDGVTLTGNTFANTWAPVGLYGDVFNVVDLPPIHNVTQGTYYFRIQGAIDDAADGDVIEVADGTYDYDSEGQPADAGLIKITVPVTLRAENDDNGIRPVINASGAGGLTNDGVFKIHATQFTGGTVVIEGFDITGIPQTGIAITAAMYQVPGQENTIIIRDNLIHGMIGGIDIWGTTTFVTSPDPANAVTSHIQILNNDIYDMGVTGIVSGIGILVEDPLAGTDFAWEIVGNNFYNFSDKSVAEPSAGIVLFRADAANNEAFNLLIQDNDFTGPISVDVAVQAGSLDGELDMLENDFSNNGLGVLNLVAESVDATENWWGSIAGPDATQYLGNVDYDPWCGDAACSFLVTKNLAGELELSGNINVPGGIVIDEEGLTIKLMDGAVVENDSPCFIINASYTKITTESIGGAQCIPTDASNGIDVAAGLKNIIIEGIEFVGTTGTDAIHFAGAIEDLVIRDNFIHDFAGDGIEFAGTITNNQGIQGNLFLDNGGLAIKSGVAVNAEYNSWGVYAPAAITNVDMDFPTHVGLYVESSGTPWANQVETLETITYTVYGNLKNVMGAEFTLDYPETALTYVSQTLGGQFETEDLTVDTTNGKLTFMAYSITTGATTGEDLALFTVTFTAKDLFFGTFALDIDETTDTFGMGPTYGPSLNIYATELLDGEVTIIAMPTITSDDIDGYYLTDEMQEFHVTVDNPLDGGDYAHVIFKFELTADYGDISLFEYWTGSVWAAMPLDCTTTPGTCVGYYGPSAGFPMGPDYEATSLFHVTFAEPGEYPVSITLVDLDAAGTVLATFSPTAYVYDPPTISSTDIQGYYLTGEQREFHVRGTNPLTGNDYSNVMYKVIIQDALVSDITDIQYYETWPTTGYVALPLTQVGDDVVAWFGLAAYGGFPMPPGFSDSPSFLVTWAQPGVYDVLIEQYDVALDPDRLLVDELFTATVYTQPTISSTDLDGPYVAGIAQDFTLTITDPDEIPEPFELVFDFPAGTTIVYDGVTYTCDLTGCPPIPVKLTAASNDLTFTVTFSAAYSGPITVELYDSNWVPDDRLLATYTEPAVTVTGDFTVTATVTMQARTVYNGVVMTLTDLDGLPLYGPFEDTSDNVMSENLSIVGVMGGTYQITTTQDRYLNVIVANNKTLLVNGAEVLPQLHLRGGNVLNTGDSLNAITLGDASVIAGVGMYGATGDPLALAGDANFDGRVNIQDLALVGGNYGLTSETAYGVGNANIWVIN